MKTEGMNTELTLDELNDVWGGGAWADLVNNPVAQTAAVTIMQVATVTPFAPVVPITMALASAYKSFTS